MSRCGFCGRPHPSAIAPPAPRTWRMRARMVWALAADLAAGLAGAVDALVSAALGVHPIGVRLRRWRFRITAAYERAGHPDVIDAEVIDDEGAAR